MGKRYETATGVSPTRLRLRVAMQVAAATASMTKHVSSPLPTSDLSHATLACRQREYTGTCVDSPRYPSNRKVLVASTPFAQVAGLRLAVVFSGDASRAPGGQLRLLQNKPPRIISTQNASSCAFCSQKAPTPPTPPFPTCSSNGRCDCYRHFPIAPRVPLAQLSVRRCDVGASGRTASMLMPPLEQRLAILTRPS